VANLHESHVDRQSPNRQSQEELSRFKASLHGHQIAFSYDHVRFHRKRCPFWPDVILRKKQTIFVRTCGMARLLAREQLYTCSRPAAAETTVSLARSPHTKPGAPESTSIGAPSRHRQKAICLAFWGWRGRGISIGGSTNSPEYQA